MAFEKKLKEVQQYLIDENVEGWLLYDFKGNNPLAHSFLEIHHDKFVTRRFFYWIPKKGDPIKIVPLIEPYTLDHLPGIKWFYRTWMELERLLFSIAGENGKIAMEYSPSNSLPTISIVDAGTIELIKKGGAQVISSANILQKYTSVLNEEQVKSHFAAASVLQNIINAAWDFIRDALKKKTTLTEYQVQQFILEEMFSHGCTTDHPPICAVNANSADPHYSPQKMTAASIKPNDFVLIDLWCKQKNPQAVFADVTWVGVAAAKPTPKQQEIFALVKKARDEGTKFIQERLKAKQPIQGWEVDQKCRDVVEAGGYGDFFIHRTGHNLGIELHGSGANLDNYETHDFRQLLPGTCFTIEPGIYIPQEFGVRLEYDIYLTPELEMKITGGIQENIICLME